MAVDVGENSHSVSDHTQGNCHGVVGNIELRATPPEEKGYVTATEFDRFCNSTVPLARLPKRVFTTDETLKADLEVAHFGSATMENAVTEWRLVDDAGKARAHGELPSKTVPVGNGIALGRVDIPLKVFPAPAHYRLVVTLHADGPGRGADRSSGDAAKRSFENDWNIWIYPSKVDTSVPAGIAVVTDTQCAPLRHTRTRHRECPPGNDLWFVPNAFLALRCGERWVWTGE